MNPEDACAECRRLLGGASASITRQLRAIARLDEARLRHETALISSLQAEMEDAQLARENAMTAYHEHRRRHQHGLSNAAANGS
jgi:hypothetical protein